MEHGIHPDGMIPPVSSFFVVQKSHNMLISPQTAAATGNVDQPQLLRLVSWSAHLAVGVNLLRNALVHAKTGMGSFTRQTFLTKGKMSIFRTHRIRRASIPGSTTGLRVLLVSGLLTMKATVLWKATTCKTFTSYHLEILNRYYSSNPNLVHPLIVPRCYIHSR